MAAQRNRTLNDPYPKTLEGVHEDMDYWAARQNAGEPGSPHEEGVKNRLEHLRNLERRFEKSQEQSSNIVFISCGQYTEEEKRLGRKVAGLVSELTPFTPYFADFQSSLEALTENILGRLHKCVGFIAIMQPRGDVVYPGGTRHTRGSVWIEQEIAIAAFVVQVLNRPVNVAAYIHRSIKREGIRDQLHLNPVAFGGDDEVLDSLRNILPTWNDLSTDVAMREETRRNRERHVYKAIQEGRELLSRPPHRDEAVRAVIEDWLEEVKQWEQRTHDLLATFSEQASVTFRDDANLGAEWFANAAQGDTQVWLRKLNRRLANLSKITEQPDTYLKA